MRGKINGIRKLHDLTAGLPLEMLGLTSQHSFHVAEDLITTLVTLFIAARTVPSLVNSRVQLVFTEGYSMDSNHFTPLWDRVGAWAPRRLSLDPWQEGECRE